MEEAKYYLQGPIFGPYSFINISCGKEEMDDLESSRKNIVEVALVIKIVQNLYKAWKGLRRPLSIAIASPYSAQVVETQEKLGEKYKSFDNFVVNVMLIEELAEKEDDIVILSTVRAHSNCSISLPSDHLRIDLASIRARHCLWILGNEAAQSRSDSGKSIIQDAKDRKHFFNIEEDRELHEFVMEVRKEIDQLDALLDADGLLFRNTRWKVLFSDNFKKAFENIECSQTKKLVINLLLRLANGWRPKRRYINITCDRSKHFLKQFKVKSLYVICSIDIVKEHWYAQVLKVWDILPLVDIPVLVKRLDDMFLTYTDDFLDRCKTRCVEGDLEIPMSWETSCDIIRHEKSSSIKEGILRDSKVSDSLLLMKFYSVSSGMVSHLLSGCDGRELELPFELTGKETEIVHFDRSSFVLGRSGTGKTTVLVRKLFQREQLIHIASEGFHKIDSCTFEDEKTEASDSVEETKEIFLRQIFVTLNPRLCYAVKEDLSSMKRFVYGGKTSEEEYNSLHLDDMEETSWFGAIPDSFMNLSSNLYPLSITLHKFLMMLDRTVGTSFFDRFPQARVHSHGITRTTKSIALKTFIRMKEVTFEKFDLSYWPHFNKDLTKSLEASTVFTEIMSHIKGGFHSGFSHDKLSLEDYISLSRSRVSNFNAKERKGIYDIFLLYEKQKTINGEYDAADLVIDLHRRLKESEYNGDRFDFVYVDEVQDLTMRQIALFKYICSNVHDGFFFTGDTAQTIAKGVDYRFEDIRCLFYEAFLMKSGRERNYGKGEKGIVTDLFHLNENFRTHASVLKLAQSITNLLYHFFPRSIDVLKPETSLVGGETPVLIESSYDQNALTTMFGNAGEDGKNLVGFGAEQVILVRDDDIRNEILKYVGKHALILTISECKGLEFQDVLLYNFLSSSPMESQWRVIYNYMKDLNILNEESPRSFPRFDEAKHRLLCSELKQLYVAITRTKQRLWILEDADEICKPMFKYWKLLQSVEVRKLDDLFVNEIKVLSSKNQWKLRGIELFNQNKYETARMCFDKAGEEFLKKWAEAAGLRASAWTVSCSNSNMARVNLRQAAKIFSSIGKFEASARCCYESEDYELAGEIYMEKFGNSKLEEAGECFALAGLHDRAVLAFARGNFFSNCLDSCIEGKLFDEGLNYIKDWKNYVTLHNNMDREKHQIKSMELKLLGSAAIYYKKLGDNVTMMKYVKSFHSENSMRVFLKTEDCLDELLQLEKEWGSFQNAANVAKQMGKTMLQVDLLEKAECFNEASSTILSYVFACSLWGHGGDGWPLKEFRGKKELLDRAKSLAEKGSFRFFDSVCQEIKILSSQNSSLRDLVQSLSESKGHQSVRGEILCAWKILDAHFTFGESEYACNDVLAMDKKMHAENSLSKNQVSIGTLIFIWDVWKKKIERIFDYLGSSNSKDVYGEFCMNYLGVTMTKHLVNDKTIYLLLCSDAYWVKQISEQYLRRKWDSVSCKAKQFVHAARCYWSSEMLSVGIKVLEKLRNLYEHSKLNSSPLHCQVIPLVHMFGVAKSLIDSKFLHRKYNDNTLHGYLKVSLNSFMGDMFPLDWTKLMTLNMAKLRETEDFRRFLEAIARDNISLTRQLTIEKLGKVTAMIIAVGGRFNEELCRKVYQRFDDLRSQKGYIEIFGNIKSEHERVSRVLKFHKALELIYYAESFGQSEYISPGGFMYLVERVLITTFYLKGHFFSTKSSFAEWLINQDRNKDALLNSESDWQQHFIPTLDIVAAIIAELLCNTDDVAMWIHNFKLVSYPCRPLLVLRLFVALCLLCVNTGKYHDLLSELLNRKDFTSHLPAQFCNIARKLKPGCLHANVRVLAEAFKVIDNPLVIASSRMCIVEVQDAIFVDLDAQMERAEIFKVLFNKC